MDLTETIQAKTDQQNSDDYVGGPKTVTISKVTVARTDQPVSIHLEEFPGKPYKPSKSMRRVLVQAWGPDSDVYAGRRLTLYRDPTVKFGGDTVGGLKISHMSHLDKAMALPLTETRGKKALHKVQPLKEQAQQPAMISKERWEQIMATYGLDFADTLYWASEQVKRSLNTPQEITAAEAEQLLATLKAAEEATS